jgi:hypothetical protein
MKSDTCGLASRQTGPDLVQILRAQWAWMAPWLAWIKRRQQQIGLF